MITREETGVFWIDLIGVAVDLLLPQFNDYIELAKSFRDDRKKNNEVFKIINRSRISGGLSDQMYDKLHEDSHGIGIVEFDLISTAVRTNKWINYAMWCMCDDESVLLKAPEDAKEFINAVSMTAGFGKIYASAGIADLNEYAIENEKREPGTKYLLSIEDLKKRFEDPDFRTAMRLKLAKLQAQAAKQILSNNEGFFGTPSRIDEDGLVHPIFFSNSSLREVLGPKQGNIDDELFKRLEAVLSPMLTDVEYKYSYDIVSKLPILTIQRRDTYGATENFLIDDGRVMGGSTISILGTYIATNGNFDYIFVDVKKLPHIAYSILNRAFYQLNNNEVSEAFSVMLQNYAIYNAIDFSNTLWFDYLTPDEKVTLTNNLSYILEFMKQDPHLYYLPRLRFLEYINADNFTLISDNQVQSPLQNKTYTSPEICEGLTFKCTNGEITQYFYGMPNAQTSMINTGGFNYNAI
ncbi:MAG: hypothetical protein IKR19_08975 [Acholeplasmatales bacterium]|nr:hypothetical protein [Acholeplasmatales bacterium]